MTSLPGITILTQIVEFDKLLASLMKILIEFAGAQTSYLILESDGEFKIEASGEAESKAIPTDSFANAFLQSLPLKNRVPVSLIDLVTRTQTPLVLADALQESPNPGDPYLKRRKPKSILCYPLLHQEQLLGIIYLENRVQAGAFTNRHLELIELLSTSTAIALINGRRYIEASTTQRHLQQILDTLPVGISVHNRAGQLIYLNSVSKQLLNLEQDVPKTEIANLSQVFQVYRLGSCELYPVSELPLVRSLLGETARADDLELHQGDRVIPLEVRSHAIFDETGSVEYAIAAFNDISERLAAQKALRESEAHLKAAQKVAQIGSWSFELATQQIDCSPKTCLMFGFEPNQDPPSYEELLQRIHPEQQGELRQALAYAISQGEPYQVDLRVVLPDGSIRYIDSRVEVVFNERGEVTQLFGICIDVSDRKQVELALLESETQFRRLAENIPGVVYRYIIHADGSDRFTYLSPRCWEIYELDPQIILQDSSHFWAMIHPEDRPLLQESADQSLVDPKPWSMEYRIITPSGQLKWLHGSSMPEQQPNGDIVWDGLIIDITRRKQAQKALEESEQRYATLAQAAPVGIFRNDVQGNCLYGNERSFEMIGISQEEAMATGWTKTLHPDDRDRVTDQWIKFVTQNVPFHCEYRFLRPDGTTIWVFGQAIAERDSEGKVTGYIGTITDITAAKQIEAALRESEAKFRRLAENVPGAIYRYVLHPDGSHAFTYASPAICELYGYTAEEILADPQIVWQVTHPDDIASLNHSIRQSAETLQPWRWEGRILFGKQLKWIQGISRPEKEANGDIVWDGLLIDITQRKQIEQFRVSYNGILEQQVRDRTLALEQEIKDRNFVEEALRESEKKFRAIFDQAFQFVGLLQPDGILVEANQTALESAGVSRDEVVGKPFWETKWWTISPETQARLREAIAQAAQGEFIRYQVDVLGRDNRVVSIDFSLRPLVNEAGEVTLLIPEGRDISEQQAALREREQAEATLRQILTALPDLVIWMSLDGTQLEQLNGGTMKSLISREQGIGKSVFEILPRELAELRMTYIKRAMQTGAIQIYEQRIEIDNVVQHEEVRVVAVSQDTALVIVRDISDRVLAETELKSQQAFLRQVIDVVPSSIFVKDREGRFLIINQSGASIYGLSIEKMVGKTDYDLNPDTAQVEEFLAINRTVMETLQPHITPAEAILNNQGELRWYQTVASAFIDANGEVQGIIGSSTDITAIKQVEEELRVAKEAAEAANLAKSVFLANMSHELRTPLNAILGFSQLMNQATNLSAEQQENLSIIRRSGEHLLTLINQVLDLSKIEAGRMILTEQSFDLSRLLEDMEDMFSLKAQEKGLQLHFTLGCDVPQHIRTDEVKLRQVLINLLSNAVKFTAQGWVTVKVSIGDRQDLPRVRLRFAISDTGVGIPAGEMKNLFKPFIQTSSGQQVQAGTGLGLCISYQFIHLMGGEITAISRGKAFTPSRGSVWEVENALSCQLGTTFEFEIEAGMAVESEIERNDYTRKPIAIAPDQPHHRFLIVDDSDYNRQLLLKLLKPFEFELQVATNGSEALEIWKSWQPHLIWMDIRMPVMDGYAATRYIRQVEQQRHLSPCKIIALTASALMGEKNLVLGAGCDDFIRKPFRDTEIMEAIHRHLGVLFIYEEGAEANVSESQEAIALADFAHLSPSWIDDFEQAIVEGDLEEINTQIEHIRPEREKLARHLANLVSQYQFEQILTLIQAHKSL